MKAPMVMVSIVAVHVGAIGLFLLAQGCGTVRPGVEEEPPPVMPPRAERVPPAVEPTPEPPPAPRPQIGTYTVRSGDSLSGIAQRLGVSWRELAELNALKDPYVIREGQSLLVPGYSGHIDSLPRPKPAPDTPARPRPEGKDYEVRSGDTLTGIAQRFGVRWRDIAAANALEEPYRIRVGQTLRIPGVDESPARERPAPPPRPQPAAPEPAETRPETEPVTQPRMDADESFLYRVDEDDTLESIAHLFLVSVNELMELNDLQDPSDLEVGQSIRIPQTRMD